MHKTVSEVAGLFYPVGNQRYHSDELAYYRQREWRLLYKDEYQPLPDQQQNALRAIDTEFFDSELDFGVNQVSDKRRIAYCGFMRDFNSVHILTHANRIIVPRAVVEEATEILREADIQIECIALEDLS